MRAVRAPGSGPPVRPYPGPAAAAPSLRGGREARPWVFVFASAAALGRGSLCGAWCARARVCVFPLPRGNGCSCCFWAGGREGATGFLCLGVGSGVLGRGARPRGNEVGKGQMCVWVCELGLRRAGRRREDPGEWVCAWRGADPSLCGRREGSGVRCQAGDAGGGFRLSGTPGCRVPPPAAEAPEPLR